MKREHEVFLGLGSNLGQRLSYLRAAIEKICELPATRLLNFSSVYESTPVGYARQPNFLNMVVKMGTQFSPGEFLEQLQLIEKELGRVRKFRWGPRVIDIDILYWDKIVLETNSLSIPHPAAQERKFVLAPLREIAPEFQLPPNNRTASELLEQLPDGSSVELYLSKEQFANPIRERA